MRALFTKQFFVMKKPILLLLPLFLFICGCLPSNSPNEKNSTTYHIKGNHAYIYFKADVSHENPEQLLKFIEEFEEIQGVEVTCFSPQLQPQKGVEIGVWVTF